MKKYAFFIRNFLLFLFFSGCVSTNYQLDGNADWNSRKLDLERLNNWKFNSRIFIKDQTNSFSAKLDWRQEGDSYFAKARSLFGGVVFDLKGDATKFKLIDRQGETITAQNKRKDNYIDDKFEFPLTSFRYWIIGIPDPDQSLDYKPNDTDQLVSFGQRGWSVSIKSYMFVEGKYLPKQIMANKENTEIRIVIDSWFLY